MLCFSVTRLKENFSSPISPYFYHLRYPVQTHRRSHLSLSQPAAAVAQPPITPVVAAHNIPIYLTFQFQEISSKGGRDSLTIMTHSSTSSLVGMESYRTGM
ncbi:unnamed protein product [Lactuca virosa]|uniref:Uncharacterized protein n=1 Tax=Lactuca virosa TaxID=75947 RepID=A0AAU9NLE6_9ASTR|nr:unnamed protein product [Lactuca virosa]